MVVAQGTDFLAFFFQVSIFGIAMSVRGVDLPDIYGLGHPLLGMLMLVGMIIAHW